MIYYGNFIFGNFDRSHIELVTPYLQWCLRLKSVNRSWQPMQAGASSSGTHLGGVPITNSASCPTDSAIPPSPTPPRSPSAMSSNVGSGCG